MGLCPLHIDHKPSFLMDPVKNLFYCYGCGRGGDVIRFVELYYDVRFGEAMALLRRSSQCGSLLKEVARFYQMQLHRHPEAAAYLQQRGIDQPVVIEELEIGCAPGLCLRHWLTALGYSLCALQQTGLVNADGHDTFSHRVVFPLESNLYGRSIGKAAAHRFLPSAKGGLYAWDRVKHCPEVILVEGLFDLAALRRAGFRNVTCALGRLRAAGARSLCETVAFSLVSEQGRNAGKPSTTGYNLLTCLEFGSPRGTLLRNVEWRICRRRVLRTVNHAGEFEFASGDRPGPQGQIGSPENGFSNAVSRGVAHDRWQAEKPHCFEPAEKVSN
jgi:DNA primase